MNFTTAIKTCFNKYATFSGRAPRSEYWWFILFTWVAMMLLSFVDSVMFGTVTVGPGTFMAYSDTAYFSGTFALATVVPTLAVAVRRLHDTDRSGWWILIGLIPLIGAIVLIVFFATEGTRGDNRFGPDPLARGGGDGYGGGDDIPFSNIPRVPRD
ncbi:MAG TPA: DUF805 domain-containing protein [Aliiroseovarius sp.]|nr:DUF805 domain-containing protein [Aliiroseovarius sp.]